jgi:hypothetical protein
MVPNRNVEYINSEGMGFQDFRVAWNTPAMSIISQLAFIKEAKDTKGDLTTV